MLSNNKVARVSSTIYVAESSPNVDYKYGPYKSVDEAWDTLGPDDIDCVELGLTVGIIKDGTIEEYWWKSGVEKEDLVPKCNSVEMPMVINMLQEIKTAVNNICIRLIAQEVAQESDEWEEI